MSIISEIINELADNRNKVESDITNKSFVMKIHLIKIYLWRDTVYKNHWIKEVYSFLCRVPKLKKKGYPKVKDLFEWLWLEDKENFNDIIDDIIEQSKDGEDEYKNLKTPENVNYRDIEEFVSGYMMWISKELHSKGFVSKSKISNSIESLLRKYPYDIEQ